jgi:CheY-like chemotaxis protein
VDDACALIKPVANIENVTILVVEKDVWVRVFITDQLREHGYTCIEVSNANQALDVLRSQARTDLLLTSLRLSGNLDGRALAELVRAEFPFIKIIMVSSDPPDAALSEVLDVHLRKPFLTEQLVREVRALVPSESRPVLP